MVKSWIRLYIYIDKVAVCLFVQNIFLHNLCHNYPRLSSNFYHQLNTTTNLIAYFYVTITKVLVQTCTTRGKQQWCSSSSIPTRIRWCWHYSSSIPITYFCVTITQVLAKIYTTRGKQHVGAKHYSSSIPTRTRRAWRHLSSSF